MQGQGIHVGFLAKNIWKSKTPSNVLCMATVTPACARHITAGGETQQQRFPFFDICKEPPTPRGLQGKGNKINKPKSQLWERGRACGGWSGTAKGGDKITK